jgi:hypothetical protein
MLALLQQALLARIEATVPPREWDQLIADVVERRADPYTVADQLARRLGIASPEATPSQ